MHVFDLAVEQEFDPHHHVEKILATVREGDVTVACWEPGQISPNHCHPEATEIYLCVEGGGLMRTPEKVVDVTLGSFVVHPRGELHEYVNGPDRSLLFRVRYGESMRSMAWSRRGVEHWVQSEEEVEYFRRPPVPDTYLRSP